MNTNTPYNLLDPDLILNAIESLGFLCSGSLLALNSYENRVYQVGIEESAPLIAKFYRPNRWSDDAILEEHQFSIELKNHDIPVVTPIATHGQTLHHYQGFRFALFPREGGRALELDNYEQLEWIGRFIGRLHAVGASKSFQHRPTLSVNYYGYEPLAYLLKHQFIPTDLESTYRNTVETLLAKITACFERYSATKMIRLHGDCHAGNVLWNDQGPHIVDLDDCLMGPAVQDIWMLISGDTPAEKNIQLDCILEGYQEFCDFDYRELHLIEPLRTLRMINYSAWLAKRWEDPAFPLNFPWYNTRRYWEEQCQLLQAQVFELNEIEDNQV